MTLLAAALLGVVQGLTEFLPVSSSAHLILARVFFDVDGEAFGLAFDVACHVGTLGALIVFFRADVLSFLSAIPAALRRDAITSAFARGDGRTQTPATREDRTREAARMIWLIVAATIPVVIVGVLFRDAIENRLRTASVAAVTLAVGGAFLLMAERVGGQRRTDASLSFGEALLLGSAQALALVPGVSRSGSVITAAMLLGLRRDAAARFTFLVGMPATGAAAAAKALDLMQHGAPPGAFVLFGVGLVVSAVVGYVTVKYFIKYLAGHSLAVFAYYRFALALATFIWLAR